MGRSDRRGAFRVALFILLSVLLAWCLRVDLGTVGLPVLVFELIDGQPLGHALVHAAIFWLMYVAMEPYVRRLWPNALVSWTRLLKGRFRDPLLGRDVLVGAVAGTLFSLQEVLRSSILKIGGAPPPIPSSSVFYLEHPWRLRDGLSVFVLGLQGSVWRLFVGVVVLLLLRVILRRNWAAIVGFIIVVGTWMTADLYGLAPTGDSAAFNTLVPINVIANVIPTFLFAGMLVLVVLRFGFVAGATTMFVTHILRWGAQTSDLSSWWAGNALVTLGLLALLILYAFRISLAGRPLLQVRVLED